MRDYPQLLTVLNLREHTEVKTEGKKKVLGKCFDIFLVDFEGIRILVGPHVYYELSLNTGKTNI
jgi:hypothetical protein